jgi:hypothetical protein
MFFGLLHTGDRSEYDTSDNLSLCPDHDSESISLPGRGYSLAVLVGVPVLDGVPEKDIAGNVTVDEAGAEAVGMRLAVS